MQGAYTNPLNSIRNNEVGVEVRQTCIESSPQSCATLISLGSACYPGPTPCFLASSLWRGLHCAENSWRLRGNTRCAFYHCCEEEGTETRRPTKLEIYLIFEISAVLHSVALLVLWQLFTASAVASAATLPHLGPIWCICLPFNSARHRMKQILPRCIAMQSAESSLPQACLAARRPPTPTLRRCSRQRHWP